MAIDQRIAISGQTCDRIERADAGAFIIGGQNYYRAFRSAIRQAQRSVLILAWDLHTEILLERDEDDGYPRELGAFLNAILDEKPELHIHVLLWDYSVIYAAEREWQPFSKWLKDPHARLHFETDDELPLTSSHHQKVVVVDRALAFAGGLDLSAWRWDDNAHKPRDERRRDPSGKPYGPYHDVQMAITGPAALALADLFDARWKRATGEEPEPRSPRADMPAWPDSMEPDFRDIDVALARTFAAHDPWPAVYEVEAMHLEIIAAARDYLYLENQYLSSRRIVDALCERLREPDGPEIVLVLTQDTDGWVEESTMGLLRDRLLELLHESDEHDRLRTLYPRAGAVDAAGDDEAQVYVHAKLIIMDDRLVKVGSSNLSNRSMRVDSELDLLIAEEQRFEPATALLDRLLGMHFSVAPEEVAARRRESASLRALVDGMRTDTAHSLAPLEYGCDNDMQRQLADSSLLDPEEPIDPGYWIRSVIPSSSRPSTARRVLKIGGITATVLAAVLLLQWYAGNYVDKDSVVAWLETIQASPWSPLIVSGVFFVSGVFGVSLNVLLVAAAAVFGPIIAFATGLSGAMLSAILVFGLGRRFGKPLLQRVGGDKVESVNKKLAERGVLALAVVRLVPIAPFPVVNAAAGSSHMTLRVFVLGSLLGMVPGMLGVVLIASQAVEVLRNPSGSTLGTLALVVGAVVGGMWFVRRALQRRSR